jgi:uncharacterized membrane protein AbrB (regulator of aidB expression)
VLAFAVLATWIADVCRRLGSSGIMPSRLAWLGRLAVRAAVLGAGLAGVALLLPDGSMLRRVGLGAGVVTGAAAWLAVPVWFWQVGSWLDRLQRDTARSGASADPSSEVAL